MVPPRFFLGVENDRFLGQIIGTSKSVGCGAFRLASPRLPFVTGGECSFSHDVPALTACLEGERALSSRLS